MAGSPITILISSAGRRVELLEAFRASARELGLEPTILATDLQPDWSSACQSADQCFAMPRADADDFVPAMLELCKANSVDVVVPTIDTELQALADRRSEFEGIGTWVSVGEPDFVRMARDKMATAEALGELGLPTPATYSYADVKAAPGDYAWPMLMKPNHGSSGRLISVVNSVDDLPEVEPEPLILQQLLSGPEYTINMYFDAAGEPKAVIPHRRVQTRAGEVEKGETERREDLCKIGWELGNKIKGVRGVICFQAIITEDGPFVFEINARFGGGYPLAHAAGMTAAKWLLEEVTGKPSSAHDNWRAGTRMLRYDSAIFSER